jgi:exopolysaccharide production protein ExoZ
MTASVDVAPTTLAAEAPQTASGSGEGAVHIIADRDEIVPLQLLRGIAASGVVASHLLERYARRSSVTGDLPDFLAALGHTGVTMFFAISGFIMVHVALRNRSRPSPVSFLRNRLLRVAPLYYLTTLLMIAFAWATASLSTRTDHGLPSALELALSFLFIPYRAPSGLVQPVYGLGWTLQYEMFFYLLFALGLACGARRGIWCVLAVLGLLVGIGFGMDEPAGRWGVAIVVHTLTRPILLYFAIGMAIALVRNRLEGRLPSLPAPVMALGALIALAFAAMLGDAHGEALAAIAIALGVTVLTYPAPPRSTTGRSFLAMSRAWGDASYSIYLTHSFLLGAFAAATIPLLASVPLALPVLTLLACLVCAAAGWLSWRFVERPMNAMLRRRSR